MTDTKLPTQCPKCGHIWQAKVVPNKRYFQCPTCRFQFKAAEMTQ